MLSGGDTQPESVIGSGTVETVGPGGPRPCLKGCSYSDAAKTCHAGFQPRVQTD